MAAKQDCERLMNAGLVLVQKIMEQHGDFLPFASAMQPNGEIVYLGAYDGRGFQPLLGAQGELMGALKDALVAGARRGEYMATALFYGVDFTVSADDAKTEAIAVSLNHRDEYSVIVLLPYILEDRKLALGTPRAQAGDGDIFGI